MSSDFSICSDKALPMARNAVCVPSLVEAHPSLLQLMGQGLRFYNRGGELGVGSTGGGGGGGVGGSQGGRAWRLLAPSHSIAQA